MVSKLTLALLLPVFAAGLWAMPALADEITVDNDNSAEVGNEVIAVASSGGNSASGGSGGDGGDGGSVVESEDDNSGGDGGSGGNGGPGGLILTGSATAGAFADNFVNTNDTLIDDCACDDGHEEDDWDEILVDNDNEASVGNLVVALASSGDNSADGGSGGSGGDGGDVVESDDGNAGGSGGSGGDGSSGGGIGTGPATAVAAVFNVVNTNITRILH